MECPECGGRVVTDYKRNEKVCKECGLVVNELFMDNGNGFNGENPSDWMSTKYNTYDGGLSTVMSDKVNGGASGRMKRHFQKMSRMDRRMKIQGYKNLMMKDAIIEIEKKCSSLNVPKNVSDEVIDCFEKVYEKNLTQGRAEEVVFASVIYIVCRRNEVPVTIYELAHEYGICEKQITNFYGVLKNELEVMLPLQHASDFIEKYSSDLSVPKSVVLDSKKVADEIESKMSGKKPSGIAGGCMYYVVEGEGLDISISEISKVCNVCWETVRRRYEEIKELLKS